MPQRLPIQFCEKTVISPPPPMSSDTLKVLISELQEMLLRQQHRIASLEARLGRQNDIISARLTQQEQQFQSEIASLKSEISLLKELNETTSRVRLHEEHQEERKTVSVEVDFGFEADKITELKADLISRAVLPEQFFISTGDPFEGIIPHARMRWECRGLWDCWNQGEQCCG
jgi:hypothetical protein